MATSLEELRVLRDVDAAADGTWKQVVEWDSFAREVVGGQLARAADSIGANIAEAFGRFHYGEKLQFLYCARGSLFETRYWLNRSLARNLMATGQVQEYASRLTNVARQLNAFARGIKTQRRGKTKQSKSVRETPAEYVIETEPSPLFSASDLEWLQSIPGL